MVRCIPEMVDEGGTKHGTSVPIRPVTARARHLRRLLEDEVTGRVIPFVMPRSGWLGKLIIEQYG
jgi:hypothetical protein